MSIWTKLFGASDVVEMVRDAGDAVVFTPEERAKHFLDVLKGMEPFKVAQRWFALIVIVAYVSVWMMCAMMFVIAGFSDAPDAEILMTVSDKLAQRNNDNLGLPVALIVGFYFAGGTIEGAIAKFKGVSK